MSEQTHSPAVAGPQPQTPLQEFWSYFSNNTGAVIGLVFIVSIITVALGADVIAPHSPIEQYRDALLLPPSQFQSICRLEHLSDELPRALSKTGLRLPSPERLQQPHQIESQQQSKLTQASSKLAHYYSQQTMHAVADLYSADFKLGNYSLDPTSIGLHPSSA